MEFHEKIAIFDLDGTLWKENSHIHIVEEFYGTKRFSCLTMRIFARFFPKIFLDILNYYYGHIPKEYIENFNIPFRESAKLLFEEYKKRGFLTIIISNAPIEIVEHAAKRLHTNFLRTDIGQKYMVFSQKYECQTIMVCTDNKTDLDLLKEADIKYIYASEKNKKFFKKYIQNAEFMEV